MFENHAHTTSTNNTSNRHSSADSECGMTPTTNEPRTGSEDCTENTAQHRAFKISNVQVGYLYTDLETWENDDGDFQNLYDVTNEDEGCQPYNKCKLSSSGGCIHNFSKALTNLLFRAFPHQSSGIHTNSTTFERQLVLLSKKH